MNKTIIWIRPTEAASAELEQALTERGFLVESLDGPAGLAELAQRQDLCALLVDTEYLDAATRFRNDLKGLTNNALPLLVLSRRSDLKTRLDALRQGANAFFPPPLDAEAVEEKLAELTDMALPPKSYRIMVVDDDPTQANFAAAVLRKSGMEVCTVTESLQVLNTLRTCEPDLILMDMYMPDASGVELATIIRAEKALMHIPIVYLSGEHDPDKQLDALSVGGEDFLTKPVRPKQLVTTVRNRIDRTRQLRAKTQGPSYGEGDPGLIRKHILELLERMQRTPGKGQATGLFYLEINTPSLLLEQVGLGGIDQIMSGIIGIAQGLVQPNDRVGRFGDFCLVILAQRDDEQTLLALAQRIKQAVDSKRFVVGATQASTTVSIGLRLLGAQDHDVNRLIDETLRACHQARAEGEGGIRVQQAGPSKVKSSSDLDSALVERVMDPDNLQIFYQPIVPLQGGNEALYQCLLRLRSSDGVMLNAGAFLPSVEQTGKILKLDRWVIYKALTMLHQVRKNAQTLRLVVSQSASALRDLQRASWLEEILGKSQVQPENLVLEFPFPDIILDLGAAQKYLESLHQRGIGISLNSVRELDALAQHLSLLPINYIKITEGQIHNHPDTWGDLMRNAHRLGIRTIVSRIEHPELLGKFWSNEVDYIQGYFVQQPGADLNYDFAGAVLG